jgi:surface polysaccharide O-acyltransferase-like enzyme
LSKKPVQQPRDYKAFLIRRFSRILIPYFFWSVVFWGYEVAKTHNVDIFKMGYYLLTGRIVRGYYFIIVIAQLYIITPFLQYINSKRYGPISVIIFYIISLFALYLSRVYEVIWRLPVSLPFYSWILFYELGLLLGRKNREIFYVENKKNHLFILPAIMICLLISMLEGMILLLKYNNLTFATSAIKYSSVLFSVCIIFGFLYIRERFSYQPKLLVAIGNYSFGIYLISFPVLVKVNDIIQQINIIHIPRPIHQLIIVFVTLLICFIFIDITRRVLPKFFYSKVLGF